ncbi:MAG: hypothetical protein ACYDBP_14035 [Leptospirales bacterium]
MGGKRVSGEEEGKGTEGPASPSRRTTRSGPPGVFQDGSPASRVPPEAVEARDRMEAIRERLDRTERRFRNKEGNPLRFWALLARLDGRMQKVQKENDKEVHDLIMILTRRAGVL